MSRLRLATTAPFLLFALVAVACVPPDENPPPAGSRAQKIYVANEDDGAIGVIDGETLGLTATIDLGGGADMPMPHNVQVAPDGASVWATAMPMMEGGDDKLVKIDPTTDTISDTIVLGTALHLAHVVLSADSSELFITANESAELLHLDAATEQVMARHPLGAGRGPHGERLCAGKLYIAEMDGHSLSVLDPGTGELQDIDVGGVAVQTACTPDQRYVFATLFDTKEVVRLDVATQALTRIALPAEAQGPVQVYPSPDSTRLYVADQGILLDRPASNKLYVLDVEAATVAGSVDVGQGAHGVVVEQGGARAFVTNVVDGTVSVVDTASLSVTATVEVGEAPNGISCWHQDGGTP